MQGIILSVKVASLFFFIVFGLVYIDTRNGDVTASEISTTLEGTQRTKVGHYLVFNGKSYPLPKAIYLNGYELFYKMKKGDEIRVTTDSNDFVASLYIYGVQVFTLQDYADWKAQRTERWMMCSLSFLAVFVFFHLLGLKGKDNE